MDDAGVVGDRGIGLGATEVVLASTSRVRRDILERAGVVLRVEPPRIDEAEVKASLRAEGASAAQAAETLAELKAQRISRRHREVMVIGADQILECDGRWFDKPSGRGDAAAQLRTLSGTKHSLVTAACVARDGARLWHHTDVARLVMRTLSEPFIDAYLDAIGDDALASVGCYQVEALGAQLFARIDGDFFTVLGLPLLPVLDFLRTRGVIAQ